DCAPGRRGRSAFLLSRDGHVTERFLSMRHITDLVRRASPPQILLPNRFDRPRARHPSHRSRSHLVLGVLEDRTVPATFTVDSPLDVVDPNDGVLTLREAMTAANASAGVDTIEFDAALTGGTIGLNGTQLPQIIDDLTLTGLGANQLTINAQRQSRIFE